MKKVFRAAWPDARGAPENGHRQYRPSQRVATSEDAERLIAEGWRFIDTLPNGKVVLEK